MNKGPFGNLADQLAKALQERLEAAQADLKGQTIQIELTEQEAASQAPTAPPPPPPMGIPAAGYGLSTMQTFNRMTMPARRPPSNMQRTPLPVSFGWGGSPEAEEDHQAALQKGHDRKRKSVYAAIQKALSRKR